MEDMHTSKSRYSDTTRCLLRTHMTDTDRDSTLLAVLGWSVFMQIDQFALDVSQNEKKGESIIPGQAGSQAIVRPNAVAFL